MMTTAAGVPSQEQFDQAIARLDRQFGLDALWLFGSGARGA